MKKNLYLWPSFTWAILLAIFGYCVLQTFYTKPFHYRIFDLVLFTKRMEEIYSRTYKKPYTELRNYQEIHFTGERKTDNIKLCYARIRIHEIIQQQDTINGVRFSFGDNSSYGNFINTLDLLTQERAERYIVDNGGIWFIWDYSDNE